MITSVPAMFKHIYIKINQTIKPQTLCIQRFFFKQFQENIININIE